MTFTTQARDILSRSAPGTSGAAEEGKSDVERAVELKNLEFEGGHEHAIPSCARIPLAVLPCNRSAACFPLACAQFLRLPDCPLLLALPPALAPSRLSP